jgi:hypothetical protein
MKQQGFLCRKWSVPLAGALVVCGAISAQSQAEKPVAARIAGRTFPSVFQAWNPADNLPGEASETTEARHDLIFHAPGFFGLQWNAPQEGLATGFRPESLPRALAKRRSLLSKNPNLILIAEIRYRDAHRSYLPENHAWWKRDANGGLVMGWEEGGYVQLDYGNPEYQAQVARQAQAAVRSGVVDGVMLDWWEDSPERVQLIRKVRQAIGKDALILVNANDRKTPQTAPYVNGFFMECYRSKTPEEWRVIADTLTWAEKNLRAPRINCVETWYHQSRKDLNLMRATTTMTLALSDGYCLFSDPNSLPTPDHLHDWYPFWERRLGKPKRKGSWQADGSARREFERGTVVYNPMGNATVRVTFIESRRSIATGKVAREHMIGPADGDLLLRVR